MNLALEYLGCAEETGCPMYTKIFACMRLSITTIAIILIQEQDIHHEHDPSQSS
jgi:hypothetical protein